MSLPPLLVQTAGSLAAILALAGLAWWLKLGGAPTLADETALQSAASEVADGFEVCDFALSRDCTAALVRDSQGRIMIIRRHGNRFAGRILGTGACASVTDAGLSVDCGERRFGPVHLDLDEPQAWAEAINRLSEGPDA